MSENARKTTQTGAQLVVRALEAQGVTHVFGVPGAKIDAVFDELVDSKIKTVVCRSAEADPSNNGRSIDSEASDQI
jgi:acetolactate synthase I/II/III large subunit